MISQTEMGVYTTPYKLVTCEKIGGMSFAKIVFLVREHLSEKISVCFVHLIQSLLIQRSPHLRLRRRKSGGCSETGTRSWLVTTANKDGTDKKPRALFSEALSQAVQSQQKLRPMHLCSCTGLVSTFPAVRSSCPRLVQSFNKTWVFTACSILRGSLVDVKFYLHVRSKLSQFCLDSPEHVHAKFWQLHEWVPASNSLNKIHPVFLPTKILF